MIERKEQRAEDTWDLSLLEKDGKAWEKDMKRLRKAFRKAPSFKGTLLSSPDALYKALSYIKETSMLSERVGNWAFLSYEADSIDKDVQRRLGVYQAAAASYSEAISYFSPELMAGDEKLGVNEEENPRTIIIDYGGPNVAKPLHVGHLRSAIIGESVKRIARYKGNKVIGDIHLGDWGYQMGLIITELKKRQPDLPYFDENFEGEYPEEAPFTIGELEEIYPTASAYAKEHEDYREEALHATYLLQNGDRGCRAIWKHIMAVSVADLKKNYEKLNVHFDLWKGEADAQKFIPDMVQMLKDKGFARYDEGALVVDVQEESDNKEVPPCMILKSDGAALYDTTDLATLVDREEEFHPDQVIYVVDKRQELHFIQVFRCAKKTGIVRPETDLEFLGFGTNERKRRQAV